MSASFRPESQVNLATFPGPSKVLLDAAVNGELGKLIFTPITGGSAGYGVVPTTGMTTALCRGVIVQDGDNTTGAQGDVSVVARPGRFWFKNSGTNPLSQANVGQKVYAEDGDTAGSSNTYPVMGTLVYFDANNAQGCPCEVALACAHMP